MIQFGMYTLLTSKTAEEEAGLHRTPALHMTTASFLHSNMRRVLMTLPATDDLTLYHLMNITRHRPTCSPSYARMDVWQWVIGCPYALTHQM